MALITWYGYILLCSPMHLCWLTNWLLNWVAWWEICETLPTWQISHFNCLGGASSWLKINPSTKCCIKQYQDNEFCFCHLNTVLLWMFQRTWIQYTYLGSLQSIFLIVFKKISRKVFKIKKYDYDRRIHISWNYRRRTFRFRRLLRRPAVPNGNPVAKIKIKILFQMSIT